GIATAGETEGKELRARVARLSAAGVARLDVLVDGGIRDEALLTQLAHGNLTRDGIVAEAMLPPSVLAEKLGSATLPPLAVIVPGSRWVCPTVLTGLQP